MEITRETIQKNQVLYNTNIEKLSKERKLLMEKVSLIRKNKQNSEDGLEIANLEFEEANLVQQINDITEAIKQNKLTLEELEMQKDALVSRISKQTYSEKIGEIKKAKEALSQKREAIYCENEVLKCEKAVQLYTLIYDEKSINEWQGKLEKAKQDFEYANKNNKNQETEQVLSNFLRKQPENKVTEEKYESEIKTNKQTILESAIEATEQITKSDAISKQVQNIKSIQAQRTRSQSEMLK